MRESKAASNFTWLHQQGGCLTPVVRSISMAHSFG
jgi:hypothetical protein